MVGRMPVHRRRVRRQMRMDRAAAMVIGVEVVRVRVHERSDRGPQVG